MPALKRILESALYVEDLETACTSYREIMGLTQITRDDRLGSFDVGGRSVLLLFTRGGTKDGAEADGGNIIPSHDGSSEQHLAFEVDKAEVAAWEGYLTDANIHILSKAQWKRGGRSIYFRDPDSHLIELAGTPGTWPGH